MAKNGEIVREFVRAWSTLDVDAIVDFFAEDGVYHNMPIQPVAGRPQLKAFISAFIKTWSATDWEILTLIESGDTVIAERIDRTKIGERNVELACCGVFQMRDGKIKVWRDYFDMATYTRAAAG